jgi:hypothetical protein
VIYQNADFGGMKILAKPIFWRKMEILKLLEKIRLAIKKIEITLNYNRTAAKGKVMPRSGSRPVYTTLCERRDEGLGDVRIGNDQNRIQIKKIFKSRIWQWVILIYLMQTLH